MNRKELAAKISEVTGFKHDTIQEVLRPMIRIMREELLAGGFIEMRGLGILDVMNRTITLGHLKSDKRPKGTIHNYRKIRFTMGQYLKENLNPHAYLNK